MAMTRQGTVAAFIESGRVLDVDISNYTLTVTTQYSKKPQTGITWSSPYTHFVNGEGMYIMPEVGSLCWVCFPSDGNRPFVLGWSPAGDEGDYRSRRQDLNPGDMFLGTRDGNFLYLRRGGIVQIGGGPLSQRIYLPVQNTIKDFCENYQLHTLGGDLLWTVERAETDTDGDRPTALYVGAREKAGDKNPIAQLRVGSHGSGDKTIVSLLIKESGDDGADTKISLKLDKDGNFSFSIQKDASLSIAGKLTAEVDDSADIKFKDVATVSVSKKLTVKGDSDIEVSSGSVITLKAAQKIVLKDMVEVGQATYPVVMATPMLLAYIAGHVHPTSAPGAPTGPATPPAGQFSSMNLKTS